MEDIKTPDQAATQDTEQPKDGSQSNEFELKLAEMEKRLRSEISGLNKKNSELEKKARELELEKMSEEEAAAQKIKDAESRIQELSKQERDLSISLKLVDAGLPKEWAKRVSGTTEEEIVADIKELKEFAEGLALKISDAKIKSALGGKAPEGGSTQKDSMTRAEFESLDLKRKIEVSKNKIQIID